MMDVARKMIDIIRKMMDVARKMFDVIRKMIDVARKMFDIIRKMMDVAKKMFDVIRKMMDVARKMFDVIRKMMTMSFLAKSFAKKFTACVCCSYELDRNFSLLVAGNCSNAQWYLPCVLLIVLLPSFVLNCDSSDLSDFADR